MDSKKPLIIIAVMFAIAIAVVVAMHEKPSEQKAYAPQEEIIKYE